MNHAFAQPISLPVPCRRALARARAGASALVLVLACGAAVADDRGEGVPGPRFSVAPAGGVQVRVAQVVLSGHDMQVAWQADLPAGTPVALAWTSDWVRWRGESDASPARQFPTLSLRAGGHDVAPADTIEARAGTHDVAALLAAARLDPWLVATSPPVLPPANASADAGALRALRAAGAIEHDRDGDVDLAVWSARRQAVFTIPAGTPGPVSARWHAMPAFELVAASRLATPARQSAACLTPRVARQLSASSEANAARYQVFDHEVPVAWSGAAARPSLATLAAGGLPPGAQVIACGRDGRAVRRAAGQPPAGVRPGPDGVLRFAVVVPAR